MTGRNPPLYFPVRQTTGGIGHRVKQFFGVATSTLNARNNKITYIINRHAGIPSKTKTRDTMSLCTAQFCCIGSRVGWVSALVYYHIISHKQVTG